MAQTIDKLKALNVSRLKKPGMYPDGRGLYLQISGAGAKSWVYRYTLRGKSRDMGLGSAVAVSLEAAREAATEARAQRAQGIDPIDARNQQRATAVLEAARATTFRDAAEGYVASRQASWSSPKHRRIWTSSLEMYAYPVIGDLPVQNIDTGLVMKVLEPIWHTVTVTAGRLRGRIESILDYAKVMGWRTGENPARWRGHLEIALAKPSDLVKVEHMKALPYADIHAFIVELRQQEGTAARALELAILCASRTNEVRQARPCEFDLVAKVWTVPAERMKGKGKQGRREHRVPLSDAAVAVVSAQMVAGSDHLFPGLKPGRPIAENQMLELLWRLRGRGMTVHGFRSSFRDWATEQTTHPDFAVETALAHADGNKVKRAYRRTDVIDQRRKLMADWAVYCDTAPAERGKVVPFRAG